MKAACAAFGLLCIALVAGLADAGERPRAKKLIEWGWDEPDTNFMRQNIRQMEEYPFDGLVFHVASSKGGNFTWEMWGTRRFELSEFQHAIEDLNATPFRRFTDRFLRVNVTPGNVDWLDDQAWDVVLQNMTVAAQIAKRGGCKGLMFDVEQYNDELFNYAKQKHRDRRTFADYQAAVRRRGQAWMKAVNERFSDITILLTFGYSITGGAAKDRAGDPYGLLAGFLDGMLDACSPQTKIVDAWEGAYRYKREQQFCKAYATIKETALTWTANAEKYRRHFEAGFGIWMDADWRRLGWDLHDFSKNDFTPAQFKNAVRTALEVSDEYVWIYTEQPRWWSGERLPKAYVEALRKAGQQPRSTSSTQ
jgi:hypothetical protein